MIKKNNALVINMEKQTKEAAFLPLNDKYWALNAFQEWHMKCINTATFFL